MILILFNHVACSHTMTYSSLMYWHINIGFIKYFFYKSVALSYKKYAVLTFLSDNI